MNDEIQLDRGFQAWVDLFYAIGGWRFIGRLILYAPFIISLAVIMGISLFFDWVFNG